MPATARSSAVPGPVLVTGAGGFVGHWLVAALRESGERVATADRPGAARPPGATHFEVDLRDAAATDELIRRSAPRAVVHLAAVAFPRAAERDVKLALEVNYLAVDRLVGALERLAPRARLLFASSGEVYGRRPLDAAPAREDDALLPTNLYAATKAAAEQLLLRACEERGLDVVRTRAFNHSGPGRPPDYVESSIARQLAALERGGGGALEVGNLDPVRDWSDVRDVVRAYLLLLDRGVSGAVYNVASGRGRRVGWVLERLVERARCEVRVVPKAERYEPAAVDALALVGDPSRLAALGWRPVHAFEETLGELLDDWRRRLS